MNNGYNSGAKGEGACISAPRDRRSMAEICGEIGAQTSDMSSRLNRILDQLIGPRPIADGKNPQPIGAVSILESLNTQMMHNLETLGQIERAFGA